jgi:hypothetical protein
VDFAAVVEVLVAVVAVFAAEVALAQITTEPPLITDPTFTAPLVELDVHAATAPSTAPKLSETKKSMIAMIFFIASN